MDVAYNELEIEMDPADRCNAFSLLLAPLNGRELGCFVQQFVMECLLC